MSGTRVSPGTSRPPRALLHPERRLRDPRLRGWQHPDPRPAAGWDERRGQDGTAEPHRDAGRGCGQVRGARTRAGMRAGRGTGPRDPRRHLPLSPLRLPRGLAAPGAPGSSRSRSPRRSRLPVTPGPAASGAAGLAAPRGAPSRHQRGWEREGGTGTHRGGAGGGAAAAPHPPPPLRARPGPCGPFIPRRGRHRPQPAGAPPGTGTGTAGTAPGTSTGTGSSSARNTREPAPHRQYLAPAPAPHCGSDDRHRQHRRHRHQRHQRCTGAGIITGSTAQLLHRQHRQRLCCCTGTGTASPGTGTESPGRDRPLHVSPPALGAPLMTPTCHPPVPPCPPAA